MKRKKLKLKKIYRNLLVDTISIILIASILLLAFYLYQERYNKVNGQRPTSINLGK